MYLVKIIRWDDFKSADFWNSFVAGVTKTRTDTVETNPLAYLPLREHMRREPTESTFGMMPDRAHPDQFVWARREFKSNPNVIESPFRPLVHKAPMYSAEEKSLFSKPQSTTGIWPEKGIMPALFGFSRLRVGILLPVHPYFCLLNRLMIYDGSTVSRTYDVPGWETGKMFYPTMTELLLKSDKTQYTEIMARLKWSFKCSANTLPAKVIPASILIHHTESPTDFLTSVLIGMLRGFDLTLAIHRKFYNAFDYSTPIIIYNPVKKCLGQSYSLECTPESFIKKIIPRFNRVDLTPQQTVMLQLIKLQKALVGLNRGEPFDSGWNEFLQTEPSSRKPFLYHETTRALIKCCFGARDADKMHPGYKAIFEKILDGDKERNLHVYAFESETPDVSVRKTRINCRFAPKLSYLAGSALTYSEAIRFGNAEIVESFLVGRQTDPNKTFFLFDSPIRLALKNHQYHIVRILLKAGAAHYSDIYERKDHSLKPPFNTGEFNGVKSIAQEYLLRSAIVEYYDSQFNNFQFHNIDTVQQHPTKIRINTLNFVKTLITSELPEPARIKIVNDTLSFVHLAYAVAMEAFVNKFLQVYTAHGKTDTAECEAYTSAEKAFIQERLKRENYEYYLVTFNARAAAKLIREIMVGFQKQRDEMIHAEDVSRSTLVTNEAADYRDIQKLERQAHSEITRRIAQLRQEHQKQQNDLIRAEDVSRSTLVTNEAADYRDIQKLERQAHSEILYRTSQISQIAQIAEPSTRVRQMTGSSTQVASPIPVAIAPSVHTGIASPAQIEEDNCIWPPILLSALGLLLLVASKWR